jgi:hypothetical protein
MPTRSAFAALLPGLIAVSQAWSDPRPFPEPGSPTAVTASAASDTERVAARLNPTAAYREHAPLAWFSLGSLAVGGVFYAIGRGLDRPNVSYATGNRSRMTTAVAVAGASAMLAAGTYFYYVHKSKGRADSESDWDAALIGAPDGAGGLAVAARISLPLPPLR